MASGSGWQSQGRSLPEPSVLILDESVAALDVSIQAQVLNLLADIRERTGVSYLFISHDLAAVRQVTDEALVMHRGVVVERGSLDQILDDPQHEYTRLLRASVPRPGWRPLPREQRLAELRTTTQTDASSTVNREGD